MFSNFKNAIKSKISEVKESESYKEFKNSDLYKMVKGEERAGKVDDPNTSSKLNTGESNVDEAQKKLLVSGDRVVGLDSSWTTKSVRGRTRYYNESLVDGWFMSVSSGSIIYESEIGDVSSLVPSKESVNRKLKEHEEKTLIIENEKLREREEAQRIEESKIWRLCVDPDSGLPIYQHKTLLDFMWEPSFNRGEISKFAGGEIIKVMGPVVDKSLERGYEKFITTTNEYIYCTVDSSYWTVPGTLEHTLELKPELRIVSEQMTIDNEYFNWKLLEEKMIHNEETGERKLRQIFLNSKTGEKTEIHPRKIKSLVVSMNGKNHIINPDGTIEDEEVSHRWRKSVDPIYLRFYYFRFGTNERRWDKPGKDEDNIEGTVKGSSLPAGYDAPLIVVNSSGCVLHVQDNGYEYHKTRIIKARKAAGTWHGV